MIKHAQRTRRTHIPLPAGGREGVGGRVNICKSKCRYGYFRHSYHSPTTPSYEARPLLHRLCAAACATFSPTYEDVILQWPSWRKRWNAPAQRDGLLRVRRENYHNAWRVFRQRLNYSH